MARFTKIGADPIKILRRSLDNRCVRCTGTVMQFRTYKNAGYRSCIWLIRFPIRFLQIFKNPKLALNLVKNVTVWWVTFSFTNLPLKTRWVFLNLCFGRWNCCSPRNIASNFKTPKIQLGLQHCTKTTSFLRLCLSFSNDLGLFPVAVRCPCFSSPKIAKNVPVSTNERPHSRKPEPSRRACVLTRIVTVNIPWPPKFKLGVV